MSRRAIKEAFAAHARSVTLADERLAVAIADALELPEDDDRNPPSPTRHPRPTKGRVVQLHPAKDASAVPETTRQRARSLLRKHGIRTQGDS